MMYYREDFNNEFYICINQIRLKKLYKIMDVDFEKDISINSLKKISRNIFITTMSNFYNIQPNLYYDICDITLSMTLKKTKLKDPYTYFNLLLKQNIKNNFSKK